MRGPKPIPSKIIELRGGTRHTHQPPRPPEPTPPERVPSCPRHLDALARKEWRRLVKSLRPLGLLTELDRTVLAAHCADYSIWVQASVKVQQTGLVGKRQDGGPMLNPYLKVVREAYDRIIRSAVEMGLTPSARVRLPAKQAKDKGKIAEFMRKKEG